MRASAYKLGLIVLTVSFACLGQSEGDQYTIKGRVVDSRGNPLADIGICFEPDKYRGGFDRFIRCGATDQGGKFVEKVGRNDYTRGQLYFLYVYDNSATKGIDFIYPPFDWIRSRDKTFNGIPVRLGEMQLIDLGDVNIRFYFGDALLDFSQFTAKKKADVKWDDLYIAVRHRNGKYVAYSSLSRDDIEVTGKVNKARNTLRVTLPEGHWKIEAIWDNKVLATSDYFDIARDFSPRNVEMRALLIPKRIHPDKL